jgi:hypothetical protein
VGALRHGASSVEFRPRLRRFQGHEARGPVSHRNPVKINTTLLGCEFGRCLVHDFVIHAQGISGGTEASGELVYRREHDMHAR